MLTEERRTKFAWGIQDQGRTLKVFEGQVVPGHWEEASDQVPAFLSQDPGTGPAHLQPLLASPGLILPTTESLWGWWSVLPSTLRNPSVTLKGVVQFLTNYSGSFFFFFPSILYNSFNCKGLKIPEKWSHLTSLYRQKCQSDWGLDSTGDWLILLSEYLWLFENK